MKHWVGQVAAAMSVWALCWTTGCAGFFVYPGTATGGTGSTANDYVYVANSTTQTLAGFSVGTATLTAVTNSPYALTFIPTAVAVNPADTMVFVAGSNGLTGFINAYSIGTGGALTLLMSNNVAAAGEVSIDVSPDGNWLLGLDSNGPSLNEAIVDVYEINTGTGQLSLGTAGGYTYTGSSIPVIVPKAIKFAPNGDYVFAAVGTAGDLVFPFTTTVSNGAPLGTALALNFGTSSSVSDNALAVNSNSSYLYIARSGTSGGLAVYAIGSGGSLTPVTGSPFAAGTNPISVAVNTTATLAYVANQSDNTISAYSLGSSGTVTSAAIFTATTTAAARAIAVDKSGDYLLAAANGGYPDLAMYSYDSTTSGKLDFSTSIPTGTDPTNPVALAVTH
jgi:6-phosphogluconolactonase (cycloisomerase 2 family)